MEVYKLLRDISVMGIQVKTFPNGIKEAFEELIKNLGSDRDFYGVSWMDENNLVQYYAMAQETFEDEASQYNYEKLTLTKGEYKTEILVDWMSKTDRIKDLFHQLMPDKAPDKNLPAIEWYKSEEEMICMIRVASY